MSNVMNDANGYVLYEGPSLLDGAPIVVIATGFKAGSTNRKTGEMVQTYILRQDVAPTDAIRSGEDSSICGDCPHRGRVTTDSQGQPRNVGRTCYVNVGQGPLAVFRAYKAGKYPAAPLQLPVTGRMVRLGTYGDPAAVPVQIWQSLLHGSVGHTGYTHQWRNPAASPLKTLCMASADSASDAIEAHSMGWRTFRVSLNPATDPLDKATLNEALCPASAEAGKKLTCAECKACNGTMTARRGSIYIPAHGGFAVMANVRRKAA
jgi:hypothetical protein